MSLALCQKGLEMGRLLENILFKKHYLFLMDFEEFSAEARCRSNSTGCHFKQGWDHGVLEILKSKPWRPVLVKNIAVNTMWPSVLFWWKMNSFISGSVLSNALLPLKQVNTNPQTHMPSELLFFFLFSIVFHCQKMCFSLQMSCLGNLHWKLSCFN